MTASLALVLAAAILQVTPVDVSIATIATGSRAELTLVPNGRAELRGEGTVTQVRIQIDRADTISGIAGELRAWVAWAVSPEGQFENLGELERNGREAELDTVTSLTRFGILVTAEPHFRVDLPGASVAVRSGPPRNDDTRVEYASVEIGHRDYSGFTLPPQGSIHPRVSQARMAVAIAETDSSEGTSSATLRQARVALESMEQLLRRDTPLDVVLTYANDAIRLADLAQSQARAATDEETRASLAAQVRSLEDRLDLTEEDRDRTVERERAGVSRINELLTELEGARNDNRALTLERDAAERELAAARAEIRSLRDPWPPLVRALVYGFGARETPRGLVLTLPSSAFDRTGLTSETREWLAGLGATLSFAEVPEVWVEGHSITERDFEESEERAAMVRDYLVESGVPDPMVHGRGLGASSPIPGAADGVPEAINERVEIVVREFGQL